MIKISDCKVRFVKINDPYNIEQYLCRIEFSHNDKVVPIEIDGFLRIEMWEINNDLSFIDRWLPYEFMNGFIVIHLNKSMFSKVKNTLFKIYVHYPDKEERCEETCMQRLDSALNESDFKISYSLKDIVNAISDMDTDTVTMFNTLSEYGVCLYDDYGNMKNTGIIVKDLGCKL